MKKEISINGVVVTYNRLALLKENIAALLRQSRTLDRIIIIDNCSTDGTERWLTENCRGKQFKVIRTEQNIGGAGGFSLGLRVSATEGCDYTWLMDDDTIPEPDALELLVKALDAETAAGFVCSRVNWTDGTPHVMNRCAVKTGKDRHELPPSTIDGTKVYPCTFCTFVSVLIGTEAVRRVGLPIKEFFIWCDDIEYTSRISNAGFPCYYVPDSLVIHKSADNYYPTVDKAPPGMAGRFYYQARNTSYLKRRNTRWKILFYLSVLNKFRLYRHKAARRADGCGRAFWEAAKRGCLDGLTFNPSIEYIDRQPQAAHTENNMTEQE